MIMERKSWKMAAAFALAVIMMIPAVGIRAGASASTTESTADVAVSLTGKSVYTYAVQGGHTIDSMFDGNDDLPARVFRNNNKNYIAYTVFQGSDFGDRIDKIRFHSTSGNRRIDIFGTNDDKILNGENFSNHDQDYKAFKEENLLYYSGQTEEIYEVEEEKKAFSQYRYIVISFESWTDTTVNELTFYKSEPVTWVTDSDSAVESDGTGTIRFLAQYATDAPVEHASFAIIDKDGKITYQVFDETEESAFYADVKRIPEKNHTDTVSAVPYVIVNGKTCTGTTISKSVQ